MTVVTMPFINSFSKEFRDLFGIIIIIYANLSFLSLNFRFYLITLLSHVV